MNRLHGEKLRYYSNCFSLVGALLLMCWCVAYGKESDSNSLLGDYTPPENRWTVVIMGYQSAASEQLNQEKPIWVEKLTTKDGQCVFFSPDATNPLRKPTLENIRHLLDWMEYPDQVSKALELEKIRQEEGATCELRLFISIEAGTDENGEAVFSFPDTVTTLKVDDFVQAFHHKRQSRIERRLLCLNLLSRPETRSGNETTSMLGNYSLSSFAKKLTPTK